MEPRDPPPEGGFQTRAVHAAAGRRRVDQEPIAGPIWPAVAWGVDRSEQLAELLEDRRDGYVYGRYDNPTSTALHTQVAALHGAQAAWSAASGLAVIRATLQALRSGGGVLADARLYGGTWALLARMREQAGWEVDVADLATPGRAAEAVSSDHRVIYAETIANPSTAVADVAGLAEVADDAGIPLVVDNTFASPYLCRPLELGAAVVVESATKYLGGHGDAVGGVVAGPPAVVAEVREIVYETGGSLGPFSAWLITRGLQTLALRVREASANARAVATVLADRGAEVRYPGLPAHPDHAVADRQFRGRGFGGVLAVDVGSRGQAEAFADACRVFTRAASLGASRSLVMHPASTSHRQLDDDALRAAGLGPGTVRLACGIEDADDLVADADAAWKAATA